VRKVTSTELKNHMGKHKRAVRNGQSFLITIRGKVVARMSPVEETQKISSALHKKC